MIEREDLDASRVAEIIRAQFPAVDPRRVRWLGEGCDSTAFEVNGEWVFRFPKRGEVEQQLLLEMRVLAVLGARSPVPVPVPVYRFRGVPSHAFPRHFGGYAKLRGAPAIGLDPLTVHADALAPGLGRFLSWLHAFPGHEATRLGLPHRAVTSFIDEARADALSNFEKVHRAAPDEPLEDWFDFLVDGPGSRDGAASTPVLLHGDLAAEHILYDPDASSITGVIDWSDIVVGDPAIDLAALFHWGGRPFVDAALATYDIPVDPTTLRRARYLAACRGVADVGFGLETERREYVEAGLRALTLAIPASDRRT